MRSNVAELEDHGMMYYYEPYVLAAEKDSFGCANYLIDIWRLPTTAAEHSVYVVSDNSL